MSTYDLETTIQFPDEEDADVYIMFEVTHWGSPGVRPSLQYPGDPPEPPEFYISKVELLSTGEDITDKVEALPDEWRGKVEDIVFQEVCDIAQDRHSYGDD